MGRLRGTHGGGRCDPATVRRRARSSTAPVAAVASSSWSTAKWLKLSLPTVGEVRAELPASAPRFRRRPHCGVGAAPGIRRLPSLIASETGHPLQREPYALSPLTRPGRSACGRILQLSNIDTPPVAREHGRCPGPGAHRSPVRSAPPGPGGRRGGWDGPGTRLPEPVLAARVGQALSSAAMVVGKRRLRKVSRTRGWRRTWSWRCWQSPAGTAPSPWPGCGVGWRHPFRRVLVGLGPVGLRCDCHEGPSAPGPFV